MLVWTAINQVYTKRYAVARWPGRPNAGRPSRRPSKARIARTPHPHTHTTTSTSSDAQFSAEDAGRNHVVGEDARELAAVLWAKQALKRVGAQRVERLVDGREHRERAVTRQSGVEPCCDDQLD
jgi:hypothetical protein